MGDHHDSMMHGMELCIDGTDGAGKTPLVAGLVASLRARGRAVATCPPYRSIEVFPLWRSEPRRAAETITGIMHAFRAAHAGHVIVWDRGWPTAWVSTEDRDALSSFLPFPDLTALLLSTTAVTRMRAKKHASTAPWMVEEELIVGFNEKYRALAHQPLPAAPKVVCFEPDQDGRFGIPAIVEALLAQVGLS